MHRSNAAGLSYGQVFLLIVGFGLASGLIFLFGIWVGRDIAERRLVQEERIVRLPMPAAPTPSDESKGDVDVSFYQALKEKAYQREAAAAGTPREAAAAPREAAVATPTIARIALADTPTTVPTRAPSKPTPVRTAIPTPRRADQPESPERQEHPDEWADAGWTVQVNATTNVEQAVDLARRLKAKGLDAYTVQAPMRGQTWYRVRVGRFKSREKAKDLETRLRTDEGLDKAYVTPQ